MQAYAQTIPQLYRQLQQSGYSVTEMCCVRNAYELATELFSSRFQSSGRVFIAHVVGTASILVSLHLPAEVIAAGLLHNAYENGDFGDGREGITNAKRAQVQRAVGKDVERYVARFATSAGSIRSAVARSGSVTEYDVLDRQIILLLLADHLEHLLDLNALYNGSDYEVYIRDGDRAATLAEQLGYTALASELRKAAEESRHAVPPTALRDTGRKGRLFIRAPQSHCLRWSLQFRRLGQEILGRLRSSTKVRKLVRFKLPPATRKNGI